STRDVMIPIDVLEGAVRGRRYEEALSLTVDTWRSVRAATLADLVDALAPHVATEALATLGPQAFQILWLVRAHEARTATLSPLLGALTRRVPVEKGADSWSQPRERYAAWTRRVEALARLPDDPRTATALVAFLKRRPEWLVGSIAALQAMRRPV